MELLNQLLEKLMGLDVMPGLVGAVAGLYVQADEYDKISVRKAILVFVSSLATAHFLGNLAVGYWDMDTNGSSATKFMIATYTPDIMQATDKVVGYYKENPLDLLNKLLKKRNDEKTDVDRQPDQP